MYGYKYCKSCYDTIKLANDLALKRCVNCHQFFDASQSSDSDHCPDCFKKIRICKNCGAKFIPDEKILLCPMCYSNIVKTCNICKKDFIPRSGYRTICPQCHQKEKHLKIPKITTKKEDRVAQKIKRQDRTFELLIKALDDENICEFAQEKLIEMEIESIDIVIRSLNCKNIDLRRRLVDVLVGMGEFSVDHLIETVDDNELDDNDYLIKKGCVKALGKIGDQRAVDPLINTLDDFDSFVRQTSAKALGLLADKRALEPLINSLKNDTHSGVKVASASALGKLGDQRAIEPLRESLYDDNPTLVIRSLKSLIEIDEEIGMSYLFKNMDNPNKNIAEFSKGYIVSVKGEEYLEKIPNEIENEKINKDDYLKLISNLFNDDPEIKIDAAKRLGTINNPKSAEYLIDVINDNENKVRLEIIHSLGKLKNVETLPILIKTLKDKDISIRWAAEEAISLFGSNSLECISESLKTEDDELRYYLVTILGEIKDDKSVQILIKTLNDPDLEVKIVTIDALAKVGNISAIKPLFEILNDEERRIRKSATYAIIKIGQEEDLKALKVILKTKYFKERWTKKFIKKINIRLEKIEEKKKLVSEDNNDQTNESTQTKYVEDKSDEGDFSDHISEYNDDELKDPFDILDAINKE